MGKTTFPKIEYQKKKKVFFGRYVHGYLYISSIQFSTAFFETNIVFDPNFHSNLISISQIKLLILKHKLIMEILFLN